MKTLIIANWKMNPQTLGEAQKIFSWLDKKKLKNIKLVACPPFVYLGFKQGRVKLGSQDCFWGSKGAFTGEISISMLKNLGCQYVIVGHSERRRFLNETDEIINKKIKLIARSGLTPVLCIGEEHNFEKTVKSQIRKDLKGVALGRVIIAYEPVWAIGTGRACKIDQAKKRLIFLRNLLASNKVLYGGSVDSKNALGFIEAGFDGLLIGKASLDTKELDKVLQLISSS